MEQKPYEKNTGVHRAQSGLYDRASGSDDPGGCFLESLPEREKSGKESRRKTAWWGEVLQCFRK